MDADTGTAEPPEVTDWPYDANQDVLRLAISDPGSLVERAGCCSGCGETLSEWQARASEVAVRPFLSGSLTAGLQALTDRLWANKVTKGFNTSSIPLEFCLLTAEVGEAIDAWRKNGDIAGELADVLLFTLSLARMLDVDLDAASAAKMTVNEQRTYRQLPNGLHVQAASHD